MMFGKSRQERDRARAIKRLGALEDLAEPGFDRFVQQAADAFAAPIALLTLLHGDRQWVKASVGVDLRCSPRDESFCNVTVDRGQLLEVCNSLEHPDFSKLPLVIAEPRVRYYLGAPLRLTSGIDVGALCVVDTQPRPPASRDQRAFLVGLARQTTQALEQRVHGGLKRGLAA